MPTIAWTCSDGPLVGFAGGFERKLVELGYRPGGVARHLRLMRQLNRWLADAGLAVGDLDRQRVEQFLAVCRTRGQRRVPTLVSATALLGVPERAWSGRCRIARRWKPRVTNCWPTIVITCSMNVA